MGGPLTSPRESAAPPSARNPWVPFESASSARRARVFCFPFAGGGASFFRAWARFVPPVISLCPVQTPGREERIAETPLRSMEVLVAALVEGLAPLLRRPFAFFGHSLGALVAFELTQALRLRGEPLPEHLFVSGAAAPHLRGLRRRIHDLPRDRFVEEIRRLGGVPDEVLAHADIMELFIPRMRADFTVTDDYACSEAAPLPCAITVFGGLDDPVVGRRGLDAWAQHTVGPFQTVLYPGGHFFLNEHGSAMVAAMAARLT